MNFNTNKFLNKFTKTEYDKHEDGEYLVNYKDMNKDPIKSIL